MPADRLITFAAGLLLLVGCAGDVRFEPDRMALVSRSVAPGHAEDIEQILTELFGAPDEPRLPDQPAGLAELIDLEQVQHAAGPVASHRVGVTTGLYRRHCARCHGVTGDGRGPTALYQHPYPRDYRRGVFKFTSTPRGVPPTDEDLHATLLRGSPGTAMPSFKLLHHDERSALVEYVKYLSIRGRLEQELIDYAGDELDYNPITGEEGPGLALDASGDRDLILDEMLSGIVDRWQAASTQVIEPSPPPAGFPEKLVEQGRSLFANSKRLGCIACHNQQGSPGVALASGLAQMSNYDLWNHRRFAFQQDSAATASELSRLASRVNRDGGFGERQLDALASDVAARQRVLNQMLPPVLARPRRLGEQPLRGGADPVALFRHIQQGIDGTPMPSVVGVLSDEEVWSLVTFVLDNPSYQAVAASATEKSTPRVSTIHHTTARRDVAQEVGL